MLTVDKQEIDLGNLKYGKGYNFKYNLYNNSSNIININKIVKGCGSCTKAFIDKNIIKPNESAVINVEFTPGSTGINRKTIQVLYNSSDNLILSFKSYVEK